MNDRKSFRFAIDAAGELRAAEFQSRSLRKVIESLLGEDWKKSPKKLLKAMAKSPDLYTAVFEARGRMIPDYIARYEVLHDKVRELSALGLKAMELTKDGLPSQDDLQADASNDIFETYAETRRNALRCHRALSLMQTASLTDWVETMDRSEFKTLTTLVKDSLERPVQTSDSLYCPLKDSPEGLALSLLMEAAPAAVKPIGFVRTTAGGLPRARIADRKAFKSWCEEKGYEIAAAHEASAVSDRAQTKAEAGHASEEAKKQKPAAPEAKAPKNEKSDKSEKPVKADKVQVQKPAAPVVVKILKTEAKLATARPKAAAKPAPAGARKTAAKPAPKAAVKASPKSEDKPAAAADDLASRLVRGLQITPSAVEHRAPGRPRKASEPTVRKTGAAPTQRTISSRPASRNKSGGAKN